MFRKGLVLITSIVVISVFVACDKQNEQASVSESVAEATEKQMQPTGNEAENGSAETTEENGANGKEAPEDTAEEAAEAVQKEMTEDMPSTDTSQIPSIDASKMESKPE